MKIGRILKKAVSVIASIGGIGTGGILAAGGTLTGDIIVDGLFVLVAGTVVIINGRDGVPDWMISLLSSRLSRKKEGDG